MKQISATSLWSGQTDLKPYSSSLRDKQTAATNTTERGGGQSLSGYHVFANPLKKKNNNKTSWILVIQLFHTLTTLTWFKFY